MKKTIGALALTLGVLSHGAALAWGEHPQPGSRVLTGTWSYLHGSAQGNLPNIALVGAGNGVLTISYNVRPGGQGLGVRNSTCSFIPNDSSNHGSAKSTVATYYFIVDPKVRECTFDVETLNGIPRDPGQSTTVHYSNRPYRRY
jgi:hypothetical protein